MLLVHPKYEIIMVLSNCPFFQYCDSNIGLFSIAPCKVIALKLCCLFFGISTLLPTLIALSIVIGLPTIATAIVAVLFCLRGDSEKFSFPFRYRYKREKEQQPCIDKTIVERALTIQGTL